MLIAVLLLSFLIFESAAQPLCTYGYSPCDPQDVATGVCVDAPGETCYADAANVVYCCVPDPNGPVVTPTPAPVCPTLPPTPFPPVLPPYTGLCIDAMPCCNPSYCSTYATEMRTICPRTCGFCTGPVEKLSAMTLQGCSDSRKTCKHQVALCQQDTHKELMRWQCTYTCGYCNSCVDHGSKCATWKSNGFCKGRFGFTVDTIRAYCARTCGYCGTTTTSPASSNNCFDSNSSCPLWSRHGFCENTYYTVTQRKQYCPLSCELC